MKWLGRIALTLLALAVVWSLFNLLNSDKQIGSERLIGDAMPEFAAPLAGSGLTGDANVYSRRAALGGKVKAACDVKLKGAFVSCRELGGEAALLTFFEPGESGCEEQVDVFEELKTKGARELQLAAVALLPKSGEVEAVAQRRGWTLPLAVDADGAVAGLYLVGACPTTYFLKDGQVRDVRIGLLNRAAIERILRASGPTTKTTDLK